MDFHAAYYPLIEDALEQIAPGEKIGWALGTAGGVDPNGAQMRAVHITFWTPAPVLGDTITASVVFPDPFAPLEANLAELLRVQVIEPMRKIASEMLAPGPGPGPGPAPIPLGSLIERQMRD